MENRVREFLTDAGITPQDTTLVAVSGGLDSMVLLYLLYRFDISVAVAHGNFGLRGEQSDGDEQLVRDYCDQRSIPFHFRRFDTEALAERSNSSVQMVARDLRYNYFIELMKEHGHRFTALAHHADDRIESLVLNVLRGTGLRGFQGMPSVRGQFIRPLISFRRTELENFARLNDIPFRTDASNADTKYRRNRVRLQLLPMLRLHRPNADALLLHFAERVEKCLPDFEKWAEIQTGQLALFSNDALRVDRKKLNAHPYPFTILKETIGPLGFSSEQVFGLLHSKEARSGVMDSGSHRLFVEENDLMIFENSVFETEPHLAMELMQLNEVLSLDTPPDTIIIDADSVNLDSLHVRKWNEGDRFRPFGMKGTKKLSDFFIDNKFSPSQKAMTWLLVHGRDIIWVMGHRMDDRFKVEERTEHVLRITMQ
ncbi:MAG: tRNA lysidine(34) synthetase TilS [Flavobacteriales bacterium]|nr:tRNA lysidine(34) synthetase TilS [Flavobacteriales bacterium]